jgi:glycosyltransferase involved in cell wall biosynthesis/GT2 family glycosyltransferase
VNENDAYIFDVEEPKDWALKGRSIEISGWFVSKQGAVFSDVRAVIDGLPALGLWGLPRPEIEQKYRGFAGQPHAGFSVNIRPPLGARLVRLELLDAGGRWVEIWRKNIFAALGPLGKARLNAAIIPDQLIKLLQESRAQPGADLTGLARRLATESVTPPMDIVPQPPFHGALEKPGLTGRSQFGKVDVEGWIIHQDLKIRRLIATTHPLAENELDYGDRERGDAAQRFPQHPFAARSHFFGMVDIDEHAGDPASLKIFAELEDGSRQLVFARRFYQQACNQSERPLPAFSRRTFFAALRVFVRACREQKIRLGSAGAFWADCRHAYGHYRRLAPSATEPRTQTDPYTAWVQVNRMTPPLRLALERAAAGLGGNAPRFGLIIDTRACSSAQVQQLTQSLREQHYDRWEAWFVGDQSAPAGDARCHTVRPQGPKDIIRALNTAAKEFSGTHLLYLPGHSRLSADALLEISLCLADKPDLELIYTDEDRMDDNGLRSEPVFKPEWSPALALSGLFPGSLGVLRRDRFMALGAFREPYTELPWLDVLLRLGDNLTSAMVAHLPLICHHARASISREIDLADRSVEQARKALADTVRRRHWPAEPFLPETAHHRRLRFHQLRWSAGVLKNLPVTIVIPTRDRLHLLQECVELLDETVDWRHVKLVIVDDHSRDADAVRYLAAIQQRTDLRCTVVKTQDPHAPFNYSRLVNAALPHIDTPLVLHLNNDVNALEQGWIEEMAGWFTQDDVGIVGAKLVYPEKTLNHTGIVIGPHGGLADTPFAKAEEAAVGVEWHAVAREVSAVTGACLMTRTSLYRSLGGFDEKDFGVSYNDVDYCLRVRAAGQRVIYSPQAKLMHWGSATRGVTFDEAEHVAFLQRYPGYTDPYFSANWQLVGNQVVCTGPRHARTDRAGKLRILLLTHNLNLEGAPLFILEYARWLVREAGFSIEVLSAQDGPLRAGFEELGTPITLVNASEIYASSDEEVFSSRIADLALKLDWTRIDLVVCNTLVNFWGVHLARAGGRPSLFYIHESASVPRFFRNTLKPELHHLVGQAFAECTRALFLCQATRAYYEDYNLHGNFRIVPSWIQLGDIAQYRTTHARATMRREHGFRDDEVVIANIGTICERKGQHIFIRAVEHFNRHFGHRGRFRFAMVGARPGIYLDLLQRDLARLALPNITLVPETRAVFDFFVAADMFVCSSYEESFPRVVMEAMAFQTPIVSTNVHGIPELVQQRADAYLVPPGDPIALSRMMWTCLAKERSGKSLAPTAYSKLLRYHDHRQVLPRHVALAREACLLG